MVYATYERLNLHVRASGVEVIRAVRKKFHKKALVPQMRENRKAIYREMLKHHKEAGELYRHFRF